VTAARDLMVGFFAVCLGVDFFVLNSYFLMLATAFRDGRNCRASCSQERKELTKTWKKTIKVGRTCEMVLHCGRNVTLGGWKCHVQDTELVTQMRPHAVACKSIEFPSTQLQGRKQSQWST
jgi:hypothetical protein